MPFFMTSEEFYRLFDEITGMFSAQAPIPEIVEKMRAGIANVSDRCLMVYGLAGWCSGKPPEIAHHARTALAAITAELIRPTT